MSPLRRPLTLRATLTLVAGVAGIYVVAVGAYIAVALAPSARRLRSQAEALQSEYAALGTRAESLQATLGDVDALLRAPASRDPRTVAALAGALRHMTERSEGVEAGLQLVGIPATVRASLADVATAESRLAGVLLETVDYVSQHDDAAARERLASADRPERELRSHLDEMQRLGLADVVQREQVLDARTRRIADTIGAWVALSAALVALLMALVHRRLFAPLKALDDGLAGVAAGQLATTLPVRRADELGRLIGHFNQMTDVLRARAAEQRRQADRLLDTQDATFRISDAAVRARTLQDLLVAIHGIVGELMPARNFYVALHDPETGAVTFPYFVDDFDEPPAPKAPGKGLTEYVMRTGEPLLATPDVVRDLERRGQVELIGAPSIDWLGVPLKPNGGTIGVLVVQTYTEGVRYTERERDILQFVSTQVAMTIERRQAEEAVRRSEEQYRTLVDGVHDVIFALSPSGTFTALNPAFEEITGWPREEWLGRPFEGLLHPDDLALAAERFQSVLSDASRPVSQLRIRTRSGQYRLGEFHASAQRRDGRIAGILGIVRDITDRVRLEEQLRHAQKMEAVGRVASEVAHEFNNLLTAVLSGTELLGATLPADSPAQEDARAIGDAARRGADLTGRLLAFSRRQPLTLRPLRLAESADEVVRTARHVVPANITIELEVEAPDVAVRADAGALHQILLNLVTNARDAMPAGGTILVEVALRSLDERAVRGYGWVGAAPGRYATLSVRDTGTGMDAATQARIFEPFFTTKSAGKGTGLGMPLVYGLMSDHGGFVQVESAPRQGTTVRLYFPAVPAQAAVASPSRGDAGVAGGTETVLVVEDDDDIRQAVARILERSGYSVTAVRDGREALAVIRTGHEPADLIISDVVTPSTGGPELVKALRRSRLHARILLTSGYTAREVYQRLHVDADVPFLPKPWTATELLRKVRETLDAPPLNAAPRRRATDEG